MNVVYTLELIDHDGYFIGVWKNLDGVKTFLKKEHPDDDIILEKTQNSGDIGVKNTWIYTNDKPDSEWVTSIPTIYRICEVIPQ